MAGLAAVGAFTIVKAAQDYFSPDIRERMKKLVIAGALSPERRKKVREVTQALDPRDRFGQIRVLHAEARRLKWMKDPSVGDGDYAAPADETEIVGGGDCDCLAVYLATLFAAGGHQTQLAFVPRVNARHALVIVFVPPNLIHTIPQHLKNGFEPKTGGGFWLWVDPQAPDVGLVNDWTRECFRKSDFELVPCK